MLRYLKAMLIFARFQAWADDVGWTKEDALALGHYLGSPSGYKLRVMLRNQALRQQASALSKTSGLEYEAGYCNGQKSVMASIESLADTTQFSDEGSEDTDLHSLQ